MGFSQRSFTNSIDPLHSSIPTSNTSAISTDQYCNYNEVKIKSLFYKMIWEIGFGCILPPRRRQEDRADTEKGDNKLEHNKAWLLAESGGCAAELTNAEPHSVHSSFRFSFCSQAKPLLQQGTIEVLLDPRLTFTKKNSKQITRMVQAAAACINNEESRRPNIDEIISILRGAESNFPNRKKSGFPGEALAELDELFKSVYSLMSNCVCSCTYLHVLALCFRGKVDRFFFCKSLEC
ncbi:unnamed protein product [Ilex paraguariensis]|uniref:Uncharacterized protein n=1 Tax=Ilex paraguariensis TaxID=185542 RepID=A0ABC8S1F5_9AQUA